MEGHPIQGCQGYQFFQVLKGVETDHIQDLDQDHCHWTIVWRSIVTKQGPGHLLLKRVKESIAKNHIQDQDYHQIKVHQMKKKANHTQDPGHVQRHIRP